MARTPVFLTIAILFTTSVSEASPLLKRRCAPYLSAAFVAANCLLTVSCTPSRTSTETYNPDRLDDLQKLWELRDSFERRSGGKRNVADLPYLLGNPPEGKLLTLNEVCEHAQKVAPEKKLALVLVKTHYCDNGSQVCLSSLDRISDQANIFIQKNFVVYHSRFYIDGVQFPDGISSERAIRTEWKKPGFDPEVFVVDVENKVLLGRSFLYRDEDSFSPNFVDAYVAIRGIILDIPGVRQTLQIPRDQDLKILIDELDQAKSRSEDYPSEPRRVLLDLMDQQLLR